jgi:hypothetical protein
MSAQTSTVLYAATVASPSLSSTKPEDELTKNKKHHKGKHFDNPWDSWRSAARNLSFDNKSLLAILMLEQQ